MSKRIFSGILVALLLISMLTLAFSIQTAKAEPKTWYVNDGGGADFTKIQDAIDAASPEDTIYVYNGTYYEHIDISKSLSLIGENKHATIIDGSGNGYAVTVSYTQGVEFTGFTICNAEISIDIWQSANNTIVDNIVTNSTLGGPSWGGGIYLDYSSNNTVAGNIILNTTEVGIWLNSYNNTVVNNTISGAVEPVQSSCGGIHLEDGSHNNTIRGNIISERAYGIYLAFWSDTNNIVGNTILNLSYNVPYGIIVWSSNNWIIGNTIMNVDYTGIRLNSPEGYPNRCMNNVVSGNAISYCNDGIAVSFESSFNTVTANNVSNVNTGISIWNHSNKNTLIGNILNNNGLGISLAAFSENNTIEGNVITSNSYGVDILDSSNNKLFNNNVTANTYSNIYIDSSAGNTICGNLISNSQNGLMFLYSSDNNVYHNNFVSNTEQVYSYDSVNVWDYGYPSGGNYWSDYSGTDLLSGPYQNETGSDGMGDAPYVIDANNLDNYPLMSPCACLPFITIVSPQNVTYPMTSIALTFTVDEATSWIGYSLDNQANVTIAGNTALTDLSGGTHYITVYANDSSGNMGASETVCFTVPCALTIMATVGGTTNPAPGTYSYTANSAVQVKATPDPNYIFDHWELDGVKVGSANPYSTHMDKDHTLKALMRIVGDVDGGGKVGLEDLVILALAYNSKPGDAKWNPNADIDDNGQIDLADLVTMAIHYGQHNP